MLKLVIGAGDEKFVAPLLLADGVPSSTEIPPSPNVNEGTFYPSAGAAPSLSASSIMLLRLAFPFFLLLPSCFRSGACLFS